MIAAAAAMLRNAHLVSLLGVALFGCAGPRRAPPPVPTPVAAAAPALPGALRWVRRSAEYQGLARQTFALAADRLDSLSAGLAAGRWGVILDADETVLDNSEYQRRRAVLDSGFTNPSWAAWVREATATAVPGAVAFTARVQRLGGRVVIVTNRADALCAATETNLRALGVQPDLVLCQPAGESDKNPRFERVRNGTATPGGALPPLTIVEWLGDNILDFPGLSQAARGDSTTLAHFGREYFLLPNPMYGSWEHNPEP